MAAATGLDASTKQGMVLRLLLPAARCNPAAAKAALQQSMNAAGSTVSSVLMDAWMECATAVADVDRQRTEVQHLIVSMASLHKQQQSELKTAVLTKESEVRALESELQSLQLQLVEQQSKLGIQRELPS